MEELQTLMVIVSAIALFIYGLQSFSKEIEHFGEEKLSRWIGKLTKWKFGSFTLGAVVTGIIQSNTGIITFRDSLLILLGTNIGTTATAWIVSFQSSLLGPFFIVLGTLVSMIPGKIAVAGKSIFYFGFIFFALALISDAMQPIKDDPVLVDILAKASSPMMGILYGIVITVIVQSSSVVVGLVIVLISQGTIDLSAAIPIVIGANIGTTSTALMISLRFSPISRLVALSASVFNVVGVLLMFPFFGVLENVATSFSSVPALQVAIAFTISNTITSLFFYVFLNPTMTILRKHRWYKEATISPNKNRLPVK
jgi:phosphate:Na+ symporter